MQFLLYWLLIGLLASIFQLLFMPAIGRIRAAIPRRIYLVAIAVATVPLALLLYLTMAFMEWMETASLADAWAELRENVLGHYEGFLEAWHGR